MCNMRTFRRIENIVETKMAAGQMFTAFDITLALQKGRVRKLHREMRRDIRTVANNLMWRYGYERTLVHFEEVKGSTFVYHPYGIDANSHRPTLRTRLLTPVNGRKIVSLEKSNGRSRGRQDGPAFVPVSVARLPERTRRGSASLAVRTVSTSLIIIGDSDLNLD